jgi:hypothetical protein
MLSTGAVPVAEELHTPPDTVADNTMVAPWQKVEVPLIAPADTPVVTLIG